MGDTPMRGGMSREKGDKEMDRWGEIPSPHGSVKFGTVLQCGTSFSKIHFRSAVGSRGSKGVGNRKKSQDNTKAGKKVSYRRAVTSILFWNEGDKVAPVCLARSNKNSNIHHPNNKRKERRGSLFSRGQRINGDPTAKATMGTKKKKKKKKQKGGGGGGGVNRRDSTQKLPLEKGA